MTPAPIEQRRTVSPPWGSDYAICLSRRGGAEAAAACAIIDTIGDSSRIKTVGVVSLFERKLDAILRTRANDDLPALGRRVREAMLRVDDAILRIGPRPDHKVFGFCAAVGLVRGQALQVFWLGDCRAYVVRAAAGGVPAVECLTRDHNDLNDILQRNGEYEFLKSEMPELSRKLTWYWGSPDRPGLESLLAAQERIVALPPGDAVLFLTDGVYLPILRSLMELAHFRLDGRAYYLEDWMGRFLHKRGCVQAGGGLDLARAHRELVAASRESTARHRRYRDSIAVASLQAPA
jgi:serine/threonine protein phosphatase PrpC